MALLVFLQCSNWSVFQFYCALFYLPSKIKNRKQQRKKTRTKEDLHKKTKKGAVFFFCVSPLLSLSFSSVASNSESPTRSTLHLNNPALASCRRRRNSSTTVLVLYEVLTCTRKPSGARHSRYGRVTNGRSRLGQKTTGMPSRRRRPRRRRPRGRRPGRRRPQGGRPRGR